MTKAKRVRTETRECVMCGSSFYPYHEASATCGPGCEQQQKNKLRNEQWVTREPKKRNYTQSLKLTKPGQFSKGPEWEKYA